MVVAGRGELGALRHRHRTGWTDLLRRGAFRSDRRVRSKVGANGDDQDSHAGFYRSQHVSRQHAQPYLAGLERHEPNRKDRAQMTLSARSLAFSFSFLITAWGAQLNAQAADPQSTTLLLLPPAATRARRD